MTRAQYEKSANVSGIVHCLAFLAAEAASLNLNEGCAAIRDAMRTLDGEFRLNGLQDTVRRTMPTTPV